LTGVRNNLPDIEWHHLVNQASSFSSRAINSVANLVPIPERWHTAITSFLNSKPDWLRAAYPNMESVQRLVFTLNWKEQYKVGLELLRAASNSEVAQKGAEIVQRIAQAAWFSDGSGI